MTRFRGRVLSNGRGSYNPNNASLGSMKSTLNVKQKRTTTGKLFDQINMLKEKISEGNQTNNTVIEEMQKTINHNESKIAQLENELTGVIQYITKNATLDFQAKMAAYRANPNAAAFQEGGEYGPIGTWDTKYVCDMKDCFAGMRDFNEDISKWDTSYVKDMSNMFYGCHAFNQNISTKIVNQGLASEYLAWDTKNVTNMSGMLNMDYDYSAMGQGQGDVEGDRYNVISKFNNGERAEGREALGDLLVDFKAPLKWNTGKVTDMSFMFRENRYFNQNCSTSPVEFTLTSGEKVKYNQFDTSNVTTMKRCFAYCEMFNNGQDASESTAPLNWYTGKVTDVEYMFGIYNLYVTLKPRYNQPMNTEPVTIGNETYTAWNMSQVVNMKYLFSGASFNQPIGKWDTSNVKMWGTFFKAKSFNQDISKWDVGNVTDMYTMFLEATSFNQDISKWDVGNVTDMGAAFYKATSFNQPIGGWNTSNVTTMMYMFYEATSFNQPLGGWNTSNVTNMNRMFMYAKSFNQNLSNWEGDDGNIALIDKKEMYVQSYDPTQSAFTDYLKDEIHFNISTVKEIEDFKNMDNQSIFNELTNGKWYVRIKANESDWLGNSIWDGKGITDYILLSEKNSYQFGSIGEWAFAFDFTGKNFLLEDGSFPQNMTRQVIFYKTTKEILAGRDLVVNSTTKMVENMYGMFWDATNFNNGQNASESTAPLKWDTTNVNI